MEVAKDREEGLAHLWWKGCKGLRGSRGVHLGEVYTDGPGSPLTTTNEERVATWEKYFQETVTPLKGEWVPPRRAPAQEEGVPPSKHELTEAIRMTAKWQAGGLDGLLPYLLVEGGESVVEALHSLTRLLWEWGYFPQAWKDALINSIYKKGDPTWLKTSAQYHCLAVWVR